MLLLSYTSDQLKKLLKKMESFYSKCKKYILFQEDFIFITSLYNIFNEKNKVETSADEEPIFIMRYKTFKEYLLKFKKDAARSHGIVCDSIKNCRGHATLKLMQDYDDFLFESVEKGLYFYKYVKFVKKGNDNEPMLGYKIYPEDEVYLGRKTWSQRMSFLKI